jgi:O-antigen/teichoic acid export membrane protein
VAVANKTLFAIASLTSFAYPAVAAMRSDGRNSDVAALLQVLQRVAITMIASILVPALMLSAPFLALWLGPTSPPGAIEMLQLLWVGYAIAAIGAPATHVITGTGTSRLAAIFAWVTACTLLGTMALLVPSYGLVGAGVANMTAMSTALIFLSLVRRQLGGPPATEPVRFWLGLVIGAAVQALLLIAVIAYVLDWGRFIWAAVASLLVFFIARVLTRTTTGEEHRLIQSLAMRVSAFRQPH